MKNRHLRQDNPPAVYGFDDRVEIISQGVLREDRSREEFFNGISKPVNRELANIMLKLRFMEQSGKGTSLIVNRYGRKVYRFGTSFMQCILLYAKIENLRTMGFLRRVGLDKGGYWAVVENLV